MFEAVTRKHSTKLRAHRRRAKNPPINNKTPNKKTGAFYQKIRGIKTAHLARVAKTRKARKPQSASAASVRRA